MKNQRIKTRVPSSATVNLKTVTLYTSNFTRGEVEDLGELKMEVAISVKDKGHDFTVSEKLELTSESSEGFSFKVEMIAEFEKVGDFVGPVEEFSNLNAAAIIYAYIRQHVSTTTVGAGMQPIILPIVNFFEHFKRNKKAG